MSKPSSLPAERVAEAEEQGVGRDPGDQPTALLDLGHVASRAGMAPGVAADRSARTTRPGCRSRAAGAVVVVVGAAASDRRSAELASSEHAVARIATDAHEHRGRPEPARPPHRYSRSRWLTPRHVATAAAIPTRSRQPRQRLERRAARRRARRRASSPALVERPRRHRARTPRSRGWPHRCRWRARPPRPSSRRRRARRTCVCAVR